MTKTISCMMLAAFAGSAAAQTVDMRFVGTGEGRNVKISIDGETSRVFAGELRHEITRSDTPGLDIGEYITFCVDLAERVSGDVHTYNVGSVESATQVASPGAMLAARMATVYASHTPGDRNSAAAAQLAMWELVYDYDPAVGVASLDLTSGRFSARRTNNNALWSSVASLADAVLTLESGLADPSLFRSLTNDGKQDQLVPVPASGPLALAAASGLLAARRRRKA